MTWEYYLDFYTSQFLNSEINKRVQILNLNTCIEHFMVNRKENVSVITSCWGTLVNNRWCHNDTCPPTKENKKDMLITVLLFHAVTLSFEYKQLNHLNAELNPICHLLALLGVHHFLHASRIRVKSLTLRLLMSYIYVYIYDVSSLRVKWK